MATIPASSGSTRTSGSSVTMPSSPRPALRTCWTVRDTCCSTTNSFWSMSSLTCGWSPKMKAMSWPASQGDLRLPRLHEATPHTEVPPRASDSPAAWAQRRPHGCPGSRRPRARALLSEGGSGTCTADAATWGDVPCVGRGPGGASLGVCCAPRDHVRRGWGEQHVPGLRLGCAMEQFKKAPTRFSISWVYYNSEIQEPKTWCEDRGLCAHLPRCGFSIKHR